MKDIMLLLDTDKHSTPFDILMAYDSGFDAIVPYEEVDPDDVAGIVQDAMFSRGVKGSSSTTIFVGGTDVEKSMEIFQRAVKSMVTPFELSVIFDPRGGHTTASALVAKIEEALVENSYGGLEGKKVTILAGTGQVGQLAAIICSSRGAEVTITSRKASKSEGIVKRIEEETGYKMKALQGATSEEIYDATKEADVVVATGKAGIQLVPMEMLERLQNCKVVADVNAVPPLGIAGLDVRDDKREIIPGVYGVGALATGDLKYKTETRVLNEARKSKSGVFDYKFAFEKARELLKKKASTREVLELEPVQGKKLTVTFIQKLGQPSPEELDYIRSLIRENDPDFAAEELGDRTIDDFYKKDAYAKLFQEAGVLIYPVDISEYAKTSVSAMIDEKKRLSDKLSSAIEEMKDVNDEANLEYVKAYAEAIESEYDEVKEHAEISLRNSWMAKAVVDYSKEFEKDELKCLFIGGVSHWKGMTELLKSMNVEVREV
ncbi:MAG: NAD(P)-dependent methylenetetrahydromethanopterin dehydrogenase [Halobacteriota archaeon]|nr:NAD(P)-dependent methylenetetrahydromethanopterin dehydrogenase [Halobacteriota archaeon]